MVKFSKRNLFQNLEFWILVIRICFEIRISCFEFNIFSYELLMAWASVRTSTLSAPPLSNTFEHSLTVAPVV